MGDFYLELIAENEEVFFYNHEKKVVDKLEDASSFTIDEIFLLIEDIRHELFEDGYVISIRDYTNS